MTWQYYLIIFLLTLGLSIFFTKLIIRLAFYLKILDFPEGERKIHRKKTPLLGGLAIFLSFFLILFCCKSKLLSGNLEIHHWLGFFSGACFLMIGGFLDDKYNLSPGKQIIWPLLASLCIVAGGVEIIKITNPLGGLIYLNTWKVPLWKIFGNIYYFIFWVDLFTIIWLMIMMYTTKLLDGLDGLVTGISAIGGIIIFLFTITTKYYQPDIGLAALIFAAACLGFLFFNWHPAKIFLGEGGSLLLGYILGVLAIISGGKIAITLLVLGLPLMDLIWTISRRILKGKNPFKNPDKSHLHHRLLDLGISQRKTVLIFYFFALFFGGLTLFLQSRGKLLALLLLILIMLITITVFSLKQKTPNYD